MSSPLQKARHHYQVALPKALKENIRSLSVKTQGKPPTLNDAATIKDLFPHSFGKEPVRITKKEGEPSSTPLRIGAILSGGQAPGGHNVLVGIFDALKNLHSDSKLIGFLGGPSGILHNKTQEIDVKLIDEYRNTGGFDLIGSGRTKLTNEQDYKQALAVANEHQLNGLLVIGGDDSNTNAAVLAEFFQSQGSAISVVGVPKTIDGDLRNKDIEISFGFDTATKVYSDLIGNIARDALSARKYWHFIKLMGRSASHITLECALKTHPNVCLISEEVAQKKQTLEQLVDSIAKIVIERSNAGYNFGVALIPEGLIEFIPQMNELIEQLNTLLAKEPLAQHSSLEQKIISIEEKLDKKNASSFISLPKLIQGQLLNDRDPHGNVSVSSIETEKLLLEMVERKLSTLAPKLPFSGLTHFFGYEGRAAFPSNFDSNYCYSLGYNAVILVKEGLTGYISNVKNLNRRVDEWVPGGIPLYSMINLETRHGNLHPVIKKYLTDLSGKPFTFFAKNRDLWAKGNDFQYPGPIQYFGPAALTDSVPVSLQKELS